MATPGIQALRFAVELFLRSPSLMLRLDSTAGVLANISSVHCFSAGTICTATWP
jgi:hypothetical protein